jgi:hypothetical protein
MTVPFCVGKPCEARAADSSPQKLLFPIDFLEEQAAEGAWLLKSRTFPLLRCSEVTRLVYQGWREVSLAGKISACNKATAGRKDFFNLFLSLTQQRLTPVPPKIGSAIALRWHET